MIYNLINSFSAWLLPIFLLIVFSHAYFKGVDVFDAFIEGAKDSFQLVLRLMPYIVAISVAIGIFRSSGALHLLTALIKPILSIAKVPEEILPLFIVRPLSGPAALGITADLINTYGVDSFIGLLAATIDGSTDTTIYILAIYFASVGIKKVRYSLPVGLLADGAGFFASIYICYYFFG